MFDLKSYLERKRDVVDGALRQIWSSTPAYPTPLLQAMRYSLEAGGKRLRPILCIAASEAVGGPESEVLPAACALELIHTYSLIHDDLPAMDNDDFRRGKPTCHRAFGEATAILAGDALLTAAFEVLAEAGLKDSARASLWLDVIHLIAKASGSGGMVQGQMMDLASEGKPIGAETLETLQRLKTGALIAASVRTGGLLGGARKEGLDALGAYGRHIGLAFQLADDILNVIGDLERMGKPTGSDEARGKATGPSTLGLEETREQASRLVDQACHCVEIFGEKGVPLAAIAAYIVKRTR